MEITWNPLPQLKIKKVKTKKFNGEYKSLELFDVEAKKSRIRETKHLSTDADSSTDAMGGWTKNTQKPDFFEKTEKIIQKAKTQKCLEIC